MLGNLRDGKITGKIQFGSGWRFLNQKGGMEKQKNYLSVHGLLSRFVRMISKTRDIMKTAKEYCFQIKTC